MTRSLSASCASTPVRVACLMALASLSACSTLDSMTSGDKVDYRTQARQTTGLDVPPDLTQLPRENRPTGTVSAAQLAAQPAAGRPNAVTAGSTVALAKVGDVQFQRLGNTRWLHTSLPPEQLWPVLKTFWQERGLQVETEDASIGVMETNWAENRAKLPQDFIRKAIGSMLDSIYSTGERDKYRTRLERSPDGGTDIYITHRGMIEVYTNSQKDDTAWQPRPSDPEMEAEMLSRLLLKLGGKEEAAQAVANSKPTAPVFAEGTGRPAPRALADVPDALQLNEGFDRAWRRVGQSLDRHGFTIEDRDRKQGLFFLRYADPNQAGKEEPGFWARLFGADKTTSAVRYRVSVKTEGERSTVSVLDDKGQQQTNEIAKRILQLLMEDLR
ncbi:outer membrane protein assembly factor BamC [Roseateles amylovorans]|uniref:Outer membrane protein assembly factor BamC n=1 Tax=Roseateles amylovorans TaxID=2978473 RepID=A0ABY6AUV6_9BURK|nr:outer membrane protein assembly factor BamC [Roseateles amylovorans]UXH76627.1 outer membrane protein assembly factor BamC [Roseateles amylovorans]